MFTSWTRCAVDCNFHLRAIKIIRTTQLGKWGFLNLGNHQSVPLSSYREVSDPLTQMVLPRQTEGPRQNADSSVMYLVIWSHQRADGYHSFSPGTVTTGLRQRSSLWGPWSGLSTPSLLPDVVRGKWNWSEIIWTRMGLFTTYWKERRERFCV